MTIIFEPQMKIGDVVNLRIDPERKYVIHGYDIKQVSEQGEVTFWRYSLYNSEGADFYYSEEDLVLLESYKK